MRASLEKHVQKTDLVIEKELTDQTVIEEVKAEALVETSASQQLTSLPALDNNDTEQMSS